VGVTVGYGDRHRLRRERAACHGGRVFDRRGMPGKISGSVRVARY